MERISIEKIMEIFIDDFEQSGNVTRDLVQANPDKEITYRVMDSQRERVKQFFISQVSYDVYGDERLLTQYNAQTEKVKELTGNFCIN